MITFKEFLMTEKFTDIGKLSDKELDKGQKLSPDSKDNFSKVTPRVFHKSITSIRSNDIQKQNKGLPYKGLHSLHVYSLNEYKKMDCYLGKNNSSGYALHNDELVSVFSSKGSSGNAIMTDAVKNGAKRLDCFAEEDPETKEINGPLYALYKRHGFKIDTSINTKGEYATTKGISHVKDSSGKKEINDSGKHPVVIYMKR